LFGIAIETVFAGRSTRAWEWIGDRILRQAALYLATTGRLLSPALNASFFLRFDGCFLLSDLFNFPHLP